MPTGDDDHLPHEVLFGLLGAARYRGPVSIEYAGDGPAAAGVSPECQRYTIGSARCRGRFDRWNPGAREPGCIWE